MSPSLSQVLISGGHVSTFNIFNFATVVATVFAAAFSVAKGYELIRNRYLLSSVVPAKTLGMPDKESVADLFSQIEEQRNSESSFAPDDNSIQVKQIAIPKQENKKTEKRKNRKTKKLKNEKSIIRNNRKAQKQVKARKKGVSRKPPRVSRKTK